MFDLTRHVAGEAVPVAKMRGRLQTNRSDMIVGAIVSQRYGPFCLSRRVNQKHHPNTESQKEKDTTKKEYPANLLPSYAASQEQPERLEPEIQTGKCDQQVRYQEQSHWVGHHDKSSV